MPAMGSFFSSSLLLNEGLREEVKQEDQDESQQFQIRSNVKLLLQHYSSRVHLQFDVILHLS